MASVVRAALFGRGARLGSGARLTRAARPASAALTSRRAFHRSAALQDGAAATPRSEKVDRLTGEIASLTLLEAAELTEALKVRAGARAPACAPKFWPPGPRPGVAPPPPVAALTLPFPAAVGARAPHRSASALRT